MIRVTQPGTEQPTAWSPRIRDEASAVLDRLVPDGARARVERETFAILNRCLEPLASPNRRTGLIVGQVQSGKTLSFTTVAALAHDNGFQLVILVAGTNNLLLAQSRHRLRRDLRFSEPNAYERWQRIDVDTAVPSRAIAERLAACFADWRDDRVPATERATAFVTVLKNWQDLGHLVDALASTDLGGVTALVIDDEADQASLNSRVRQGLESATYYQLRRLRETLPRHTLLQYTATPQAPLLISMTDSLSPDFCYVLDPGDDYVGGRELFFDGSSNVRLLVDAELDSRDGIEPPAGLTKAMRNFFLGAAAARLEAPRASTRSMLVHPSRRIEPHQNYRNWVTRIRDAWDRILSHPEDDPERAALLAEFEVERMDLLSTVPDLPEMSDLARVLGTVIRRCRVEVLNADPQGTGIRDIPWSEEYAWILIGGQLLDRGFTVEGLTVTYMSRPLGVGNADTLWQRARFCGYRAAYKKYIRVFVDRPTYDAFRAYVEHEQQMRSQLSALVTEDKPLRGWRRRFLLDRSLRATRSQVLRTLPKRVTVREAWLEQKFPHMSAGRAPTNWQLIERLLSITELQPNSGHPRRTTGQKHNVGRTSVGLLFRELLSQYELEDEADAIRFSGLDCQLGLYLDLHGVEDEPAFVYLMRPAVDSGRKLDANGAVDQLFQGASVDDPAIYRGDFHLHEDALTVQIHRLEVHDGSGKSHGRNLPTLAIWVPQRMAADVIVQPEDEA